MATRTLIILLILTCFSSFSCDKKDCLKSSGVQKKEVRLLDAFREIHVYNYFDVYLKTDTVNKIEIEAGENLLQNIETSIIDGVLTIKDLNACGFIKGYDKKKLYISADTLFAVEIYDGVNLYSSDTLKFPSLKVKYLSDLGHCNLTVDCKALTFQVWYGSGAYILKGQTDYLYFDIEHLAIGYADELETTTATVLNNSMGNCFINVNGELKASILDEGNIYYQGNPTNIVIEERTGTGKLIKND